MDFYDRCLLDVLYGLNIGTGGIVNGSGEIDVIKYLISKLHSNKVPLVIFDVGANVGNYTKELVNNFGNNCIIHSFEPVKKTFEKLSENNFGNNVILHNFAFSSTEGVSKIYINSEISELASLSKRRLDHFNIYMDIEENIKLKTIDNFCSENDINNIFFLKMDVEGYELEVLKGAENMLNNNSIEHLQFEFGGCNIDTRTFFQDFWYLLKDKYNIYRIVKDGLYNISNYEETLEIFITTNYFAELKK
ncbi:FkbM family methyltransferase [Brachyspira intermedia]|uniref:FkbM family methyltransferase n=1 Tax=Brachyspira intermedia TaxID=84377 RepID=UPI003006A8E8